MLLVKEKEDNMQIFTTLKLSQYVLFQQSLIHLLFVAYQVIQIGIKCGIK